MKHAPDVEVPLLPEQIRFLSWADDPSKLRTSFLMAVDESIRADRLQHCLDILWRHHAGLRLTIQGCSGSWRPQLISDVDGFPAQVKDMSLFEPQEIAQAIEACNEELQQSLTLAEPIAARILILPKGRGTRFLLAILHVVCDGMSLRVLLRDLCDLLEHGAPDESALAPTTSIRDVAYALTERAGRPSVLDEVKFWTDQWRDVTVPVDNPAGRDDMAVEDLVVGGLDADTTQLLFRVTSLALLIETQLRACAIAALSWTESDGFFTNVVAHGRHPLDGLSLSRTVGWLSFHFPVVIPGDITEMSWSEGLSQVRRTLRSVPDRGRNHGVLRWLDGPAATAMSQIPEPPFNFNYLGDTTLTDQGTQFIWPAPEPITTFHAQYGRRRYAISFSTGLRNGELLGGFWFSADRHRRETMDGVMKNFVGALKECVAD